MRNIFIILLAFSTFNAFSQISIESVHLPDANDVLIQQNATILSDFDPELAGPAMNWVLTEEDIQPAGGTTTTNCIDVSNTPFTFQFLFNNPFDPEHNSDYGIGVESFSIADQFTVEDAYLYHQNRTDRFAITGFAASLSGIPIGAQANPVDVVYELPVQFLDQSSSFSETNLEVPTFFTYRQQTERENVVDGWGTITIWGQSFDALRVRTVLNGSDSIYVDALGFGFNLPRPESVEYKWLTHDFKVPVLQINSTGGIITSVVTAPIITSVANITTSRELVYPVPASDMLYLRGLQMNDHIRVLDSAGKIIYSSNQPVPVIDVQNWNAGIYFIQVTSTDQSITQKFMIE